MVKQDPTLASFHAVVTGLVQGVYYRAFVEEHARALGLTGYVRNVPRSVDVEVEAEGDRAKLEQLVECLHQGPRAARVEKVTVRWGDYRGRFPDFTVTY
jgi:acylphosphatase